MKFSNDCISLRNFFIFLKPRLKVEIGSKNDLSAAAAMKAISTKGTKSQIIFEKLMKVFQAKQLKSQQTIFER